ncbi:Uncharacterised protein [Yersinia frederiksenii]|nr:Uncharacterised protein [Yersinia frederiksenii]
MEYRQIISKFVANIISKAAETKAVLFVFEHYTQRH